MQIANNQTGFVKFNTTTINFTTSNRMELDEFCNGFVAVNRGDTGVTVGNKYLKPYPPGHPEVSGESWGVIGNYGEIFTGSDGILNILFDKAPGAAPSLDIIQKFYIVDKYKK